MTENEKLSYYQSRIDQVSGILFSDNLTVRLFRLGETFKGKIYKFGAWNSDGAPALAWDSDEDFNQMIKHVFSIAGEILAAIGRIKT